MVKGWGWLEGGRVRYNGLDPSGPKKDEIKPARHSAEELMSSPELLVGTTIIQRDGGKKYVVKTYNKERGQFILEPIGGTRFTTNLKAEDLINKLTTEGEAWKYE